MNTNTPQNEARGANQQHVRIFFYALLLVALYFAYVLVRPYIGVIVFALVTVVTFKPLYDGLLRLFRGHVGPAVASTIVLIFVTVLVPLALVVDTTIQQSSELLAALQGQVTTETLTLEDGIAYVNGFLAQIPFDHGYELTEQDVVQAVQNVVSPAGSYLTQSIFSLGNASLEWITNIIIYLSLLLSVFPAYSRLTQLFRDLSPLDDDLDDRYLHRISAMTTSMVRGMFVIAMIQGAAAGLLLYLVGVPYVFFWMMLATVFAIMPLGVNTVVVPIGLVRLAMGDIWGGLIILVGGVVILSNIDNLLRPYLLAKEAYLHPALVVLSAFGGLNLFGVLGVVYGPVIMIFLLTTIEIYLDHYRLSDDVDTSAPEAPPQPAPPKHPTTQT